MAEKRYDTSYVARVRDQCYLGAIDTQIAELFGIAISTLRRWRETYPEFDYAFKEGKALADAKVAKSLFTRAIGYDYTRTKVTAKAGGSRDEVVTEQVHVAPDVVAQIFWLKNRRPDVWRDRIEHAGPGGGPIPVTDTTDMETARRIAFALSKAIHAQPDERSVTHGSDRTLPAPTE